MVEESSEAALTRENLAFVDADSEDSQVGSLLVVMSVT